MPLDVVAALLNDERLENTHQKTPSQQLSSFTTQSQSNGSSSTVTKTYVTNVRKHSKPKG
ncbi:hypothetical protein BFR69_00690 [Acinetobacter pittii]|uniref:hypothetical protein n=1 Tax=Acinetobacter pittii TaxID=48296 RepID=UPI00029E52D8|nr:hypothetical protein [Acinetobacter pittii]EKU67609.1 hypothetical protein ACINWC136_3248 [Acinetobacter pittii]OCY18621.1 hypothetical protein BFR64_15965 [Acinetobacter pittii]OCY27676.1 hypothetical protein BFR74_15220 [Acinetobacter pittii]OCZ34017.1 hypothetical protein BFR69_00690 [Acinetobacter pittii]OTL18424.1 hypothetical protein B9X78_19295 [Acinetobacter pittii]